MNKHKKINLKKEQKENLPLFYEFITYNNMVDSNADFSRDLLFFALEDPNTSFPYLGSNKPISKIIDFSRIKLQVLKSNKR